MWRRKRFIVIALLVAAMLVGGTAGVVLANEDDENQDEAGSNPLLNRVCEIYEENTGVAIDPTALKEAFKQAQQELAQGMREEAVLRAIDKAAAKGRISGEEAEAIKEWWSDRPEVLDSGLLPRAFGAPALGGRHMGRGPGGWGWSRAHRPAE